MIGEEVPPAPEACRAPTRPRQSATNPQYQQILQIQRPRQHLLTGLGQVNPGQVRSPVMQDCVNCQGPSMGVIQNAIVSIDTTSGHRGAGRQEMTFVTPTRRTSPRIADALGPDIGWTISSKVEYTVVGT
ncbi:hypothetical protein N7499_005889 [Penicillium canescens]|nr:hypothetical protein N7499_005889 [Penicillium canescens]KAJ6177189.1 hypothetical protein N7485_004103 [Penicillium canescens]